MQKRKKAVRRSRTGTGKLPKPRRLKPGRVRTAYRLTEDNRRRAWSARLIVRDLAVEDTYESMKPRERADTLVRLLANIMHMCAQDGIDFAATGIVARTKYEEERVGE